MELVSASTTLCDFRLADHRPAPGSGPDSADCSVALRAPSAAPESALFAVDMLSLLQNIFSTECSHRAVQRNSRPGEVSAGRRIPAANWSSLWYVLSAFAVISYTT